MANDAPAHAQEGGAADNSLSHSLAFQSIASYIVGLLGPRPNERIVVTEDVFELAKAEYMNKVNIVLVPGANTEQVNDIVAGMTLERFAQWLRVSATWKRGELSASMWISWFGNYYSRAAVVLDARSGRVNAQIRRNVVPGPARWLIRHILGPLTGNTSEVAVHSLTVKCAMVPCRLLGWRCVR